MLGKKRKSEKGNKSQNEKWTERIFKTGIKNAVSCKRSNIKNTLDWKSGMNRKEMSEIQNE